MVLSPILKVSAESNVIKVYFVAGGLEIEQLPEERLVST